MPAKALYLKYRPQSFDDVQGQDHITDTLRSALVLNRVAHAYLFTGTRGTGKTSTARILAKAVNCLDPDPAKRPCNKCAICRAINEERLLDLVEIDAASNTGVDNIRDLRDKIDFRPSEAKYKVYVIDECFRYEDLVSLSDGTKMPIGRIVEEQLQVHALSFNETTRSLESKPIVRHIRKRPTLPTVRITFDNNRALVCTLNHKFYTPQGMLRAGELDVGQFVYANYERITQHQLDVVAGAALGDGSLSLTGSKMRGRLSITQGIAQKEYLDYKQQLMGDLVETTPYFQIIPQSFSKKGIFHLSTLSRPQIAELQRELYDANGRKRVTREYLDRLTPLGLALWYLDDGSLITTKNPYTRKDGTQTNYPVSRSTLPLYSFPYEEAQLVLEWLGDKWSIEGGISRTEKGPVIWLTVEGTHRLHQAISEYVPPSMEYKLLPEYRGRFCPPSDDGSLGGLGASVVKRVERVASPEYVYNIEVADNHNYFIRDILVANCHMLSTSAFNALLKTLEEPPPHVIFILATTEVNRVPATITSRCQRFDFKRATLHELMQQLGDIAKKEGMELEPAALELVARQANGSFRDGTSLLDQLSAYSGDTITLRHVQILLGAASREIIHEIAAAIAAREIGRGIAAVDAAVDAGADPRQIARDVVEYLRGVLMFVVKSDATLNVGDEVRGEMRALAAQMNAEQCSRALRLFSQAALDLRNSASPTLPLEMALVEATMDPTPVAVAAAPASGARTGAPAASANPLATAPKPKAEPAYQRVTAPKKSAKAPTPPAENDPPEIFGVLSIPALKKNWESLIKAFQKVNKAMAPFLKDAEPVALKDDTVTIGFFYELHQTRFDNDKNAKVQFARLLQDTFGAPCHIKCIVSPKREKMRAAQNDPLIRTGMNLGGKVTNIIENEEPDE